MKTPILLLVFLVISTTVFGQNKIIEINKNRFIEVRDNKYGVIDSLKNVIVPFKYEYINPANNRLIVRNNGNEGLFSLNNEELIPIKYQYVLPRKKDRFLLWTKTTIFGVADSDGKIIIPVKYRGIDSTDSLNFFITKNSKLLYGVYDINGYNLLPEEYKIYTIDEDKIFASRKGIPQILDLQNPKNNINLDTAIRFVETTRHHNSDEQYLFQIIKKKNLYGLINVKNETVIPVMYDEMKSSENWRYFIIKKNGKFGLIDVHGKMIKKPNYYSYLLRKESIIFKRKGYKAEGYSYELWLDK